MLQLMDMQFDYDGEEVDFIIQDVMGIEEEKGKGLHEKDIIRLIEGKIKPHYRVRKSIQSNAHVQIVMIQ